MPLNSQGYFNALRSYLNLAHYQVIDTDAGRVVLKEKVFLPGNREKDMKVRLSVPGEAIVINLDKKNKKGNSDRLFHFLDDNAKPWSKRCDFVIFHLYRDRLYVFIIEFKSGSFPEGLVDQINASKSWCCSLHSIIKLYTGKAKRFHLTKYVLSCHTDPAAYLDAEGKYLLRDHSIRHYLYQDIDGLSLDALDNTNVETIG
jgi:hypothetical protein